MTCVMANVSLKTLTVEHGARGTGHVGMQLTTRVGLEILNLPFVNHSRLARHVHLCSVLTVAACCVFFLVWSIT